jgi:hypothetical protein
VKKFRIDAFKSGGIWRFADGREITEFYWAPSEPSNKYQTIGIELSTHEWDDVHINYKHAFLCEKVL